VELLLSTYEPFWLWLGMDTVLALGATSSVRVPAAARDRVQFDAHDKAELREYLTQRFLHDSAVDAQYATNATVHGLFRDGYYAAYGQSMLKRFLALVLLLDTAAQQHGVCPWVQGISPCRSYGTACRHATHFWTLTPLLRWSRIRVLTITPTWTWRTLRGRAGGAEREGGGGAEREGGGGAEREGGGGAERED
jgi:uncharacterized membrane protein YgcG